MQGIQGLRAWMTPTIPNKVLFILWASCTGLGFRVGLRFRISEREGEI